MARKAVGIILAVAVTATALGDTLTTKKGTHNGAFEGYRDSEFTFRTDKGQVIREMRVNVKKLECEKPKQVILSVERKPPASAMFKKYEKLKFTFEEKGRKRTVFSRTVESITVTQTGAGQGRGSKGGGALPMFDVSRLEKAPDITAAQKAAVERYKTAKAQYSTFLAQSSAMVVEMDKARGARRENLMNQLRMRKQDEQPIKNEYRTAMSALLQAFPNLESDGELGEFEIPVKEEGGWEEGPTQTKSRALHGLMR